MTIDKREPALMNVLGINAYHADSSACIVKNGELLAAVEEERFTRIKHWAGFPGQSIKYCLGEAGVSIEEIHHIAVNRNPRANFLRKVLFILSQRPSLAMLKDRAKNASTVINIKEKIAQEFGVPAENLKAKVSYVEHHIAHLGSAFLVSPFEKAAVVSVDGFGDFVGAMWGIGSGNHLEVKERIFFPHSLGLFYLAITQFLGFTKYGDEYKVMGLAAYGEPSEQAKMREIVKLNSPGQFKLHLPYFVHHVQGASMTWDAGEPHMGLVFSPEMERLLGPRRTPGEPLTHRHESIAASLQVIYEEAFFHLLNHVSAKLKSPNLCLAGGCAMNSLANGKIFDRTPFKEVYIQAAAGDAGGAIGAAFYVWNHLLHQPRSFVSESAYWGPQFSDAELLAAINFRNNELAQSNCQIEKIDDTMALCQNTAQEIAAGKVVGWFQGRMEWGPRALGNRSILADPRKKEMKDILNARIKRRESFRPFAPSILLEAVDEYFEQDYPDPFMIKVYLIRPEKRALIPAITHVDGTGRLQTVAEKDNPLYWRLIKEFEKITRIPVVLNTSFNENEPIVCQPQEALDCFLRTRMDVLVLGPYMIKRP
jgi:carbamoyltransferase